MQRADLISFLQKNELTKDLSVEEINFFLSFVEIKTYNTNEMVFREGDKDRELYLLIHGKLAILKAMEDQSQELGILSEGQFFGEMAHLEDEKRSASVQALEPSEILSIRLHELQKTKGKGDLYLKIVTQLAKRVSGNLRRADQTLIEFLKEKLSVAQMHNQVSKVLIHVIILLAIWLNLAGIALMFPLAVRKMFDITFTPILLITFAISAVYVIKASGYPLAFYGLTFKNWFKHSVNAFLYSIPSMVLLLVVKYFLIQNVEVFKEIPLFATRETLKADLPITIVYFALTPVQEILARGCLQNCFRNFFQGPYRVFLAILISNLLFQAFHVAKDFWLALGSLVFGFFWGYLFEAQKSVVGVTVSHAVIGTWAFTFLDYVSLIYLAKTVQFGY